MLSRSPGQAAGHPLKLVIVALLATGCVAPRTAVTTQVRSDEPTVVVEKDGVDTWTATWHFNGPVRELRFDRPAGGFRGRVFEVLTPGYRLERDGDVEVLRATGVAASVIRVRFPEFDRELTREYEFFRRFSDGSVAIYTGHLLARAVPVNGPLPCDTCFVGRFEFRPPSGAAVIVNGQRTEGPVRWTDESGRGTYVYVGAIAPVTSGDVISVIDPGIPDWLEARTRDALPRLFALYRGRLGASPQTRPVVLFDYKVGEATGYDSGGGTLPGLIQLGVAGRAWERESQEALQQLLHFLGHEAAHVWNGEIAHYPGSDDAWMHEGSADGLTQRALVTLGVIDEPRFLEYQTAALNDCRQGLTITPLRDSVRRGQPRLAYTCGNVIALLTEASLSGDLDLFAFWRRLIARAQQQGGRYMVSDYQAVWTEMGASATGRAALAKFLDGSMDPETLATALRADGVIVNEAPPPASYAQALGRETFSRLMAKDCNGRVGYRVSDTGLLLDADVVCNALTAGATVTAIEAFEVLRDGHRAYDAVRERCARGEPIAVTLQTGAAASHQVTVACAAALPPRPAYLAITGSRARASGS